MVDLKKSGMVEFIADRLYLAFLERPPKVEITQHHYFFTLDHELLYNAFHHDFGPLNLAHLYRFAVSLHEILVYVSSKEGIEFKDNQAKDKAIVYYTNKASRYRANAAYLIAAYMVAVQNWPPHLALAPLAQVDPPFMPFRDAGYSIADFTLAIQDCVYGLWRAKEAGLYNMNKFDVLEYERYERVENGDFNWIGPQFLAFASPVQPDIRSPTIPSTFATVLKYFETHGVGLVVRLNKPLYDRKKFEERGMKHVDMFFEDGTCPELSVVKTFLALCQETFDENRVVAVHCKAGLGRTGCLIGAYLIYKYAFTANEVIAFMRIMRPGMVVGPQQHWLHLNQHHFRQWYYEGLPLRRSERYMTPPRNPLSNLRNENNENTSPLPAPTPGQPRKVTAKVQFNSTTVSEALIEVEREEEVINRRVVSAQAPATKKRTSPRKVLAGASKGPLRSVSAETGRVGKERLTASKGRM